MASVVLISGIAILGFDDSSLWGWSTIFIGIYPGLIGLRGYRSMPDNRNTLLKYLDTKRNVELAFLVLGIALCVAKVAVSLDLTPTAIPFTMVMAACLVITLFTHWEVTTLIEQD